MARASAVPKLFVARHCEKINSILNETFHEKNIVIKYICTLFTILDRLARYFKRKFHS